MLVLSSLVFLVALGERSPSVVNYTLVGLIIVIPVVVFARWRGWDPSLIRTLIVVLIVWSTISAVVCFYREDACEAVDTALFVAGMIYIYRRHFHA